MTAETIKIGVSDTNFESLREAGLLDRSQGDPEVIAQAIIDDINERGGVLGRDLEVVHAFHSPISSEEAQASCLELTQDEQVFAVVGGYALAEGGLEANLCVSGQNETILIGRTFSEADQAQTTAPWITSETATDRRQPLLVDVLEAEGHIDDFGNVAVHSSAATKNDTDEYLVPALKAAGVDIAERTVLDVPTGDVAAGEDQWSIIVEQYRSAGIDTVFLIGDIQFGLRRLAQSGLGVRVYTDEWGRARSAARSLEDPDAVDVFSISAPHGPDDPTDALQSCYDNFTERTGIEVQPSEDVPAGEPDWRVGLTKRCIEFDLFVQIAEAAGVDLTNDTFRAAVEEFGPIEVLDNPFASFGPGKFDAADGLVLIEFDPSVGEEGAFVAISDVINTAAD